MQPAGCPAAAGRGATTTAYTPALNRRGPFPAGHDYRLAGTRVKDASGAATGGKAAKLRVWRVCRGCLSRRCVEAVGAEAGAGEEAQPGPFAELGEHVPGFDA